MTAPPLAPGPSASSPHYPAAPSVIHAGIPGSGPAGMPGYGPPMSPDGAWVWNGYQWVPAFAAYTPAVRPYRSLGGLSTLAIVALLVAVVACAVAAACFLHRHGVIDGVLNGRAGPGAVADAQNADNWVTGAVIAFALVTIAAAVPFLVWLHRAVTNLPALGARELSFSPRWAVGWWFIPFANWVQPVRAVTEVWRASDPGAPQVTDRARRRALAGGALIPAWWLLWMAGQITVRLGGVGGADPSALRTADAVRAAAFAALAVAGTLAALLVSSISARQADRARALGEGRLQP